MSAYQAARGRFDWHVSSTCDANACVGVARNGDFIFIANTDDPGTASRFTAEEWKEFIAGVKLGDFDDIA